MKQGKKRSRVTLHEVAEHAGVSTATASLVARNSKLISQKTREKVLASMVELGYVYDRVAANLRSSRPSSTVGLIISEIKNPFFSELLAGVHHYLEKIGYSVILGTTSESKAKQDSLLATMMENRVGGVIISPAAAISEEILTKLKEWDIPVVLVTRKAPGTGFDYIGVDNVLGAKIAVNHLIQKGHRRIAYLGGPVESTAWKDRYEGYRQALKEAGLTLNDSLVQNSPATLKGGVEAAKQLLSQTDPPTAIFCYNDVVAFGVMSELRNQGLTPGKDVSVVGFDNIQEAEQFYPRLTTVSAFPQRIGALAADLLYRRLQGLEDEAKQIILQPELIVRDSCFFARQDRFSRA